MNWKSFLKTFLWITALVILILFISIVFLEYWVKNKIQTAFNENNSRYRVEINNVEVSIFNSSIEIENISIKTKPEYIKVRDIKGEIAFIKCRGINLSELIFEKVFEIGEIIVSKCTINDEKNFIKDSTQSTISSLNIKIGKIYFDRINIMIKNSSNSEKYTLKEAYLNFYRLQLNKNDTLSAGIIKQFDFKAEEFRLISPDSMYCLIADDFHYSTTSNSLAVNNFLIHPNYNGYDFTSRQKFQSDCIDAVFKHIYLHDFSVIDFIKSRRLESSYIEIGKMDINVFRDLREKPSHIKKPIFQELIYNYPGRLDIDSIGLVRGNVTYTEHAIGANHPGKISFNEIDAKIYKITNDTIFKKQEGYFELKCNALLMAKGKLQIELKSQLFNRQNIFSLNGTLYGMEAKELNPILERNAFLYVASGRIDKMDFHFTANNKMSTGKMTLLYHDLDIAIKNKQTDDTTAIKEKIVSWIANIRMSNSNPLPDKTVRVGIINFERNPEAFLFNYCFKSILSGIKSSIVKSPAREKKK